MLNETGGDVSLPVYGVFQEMPREYRETVVAAALSHVETLPEDSRSSFLAMVRETISGIRGYRDSSKAPVGLLKQPIANRVVFDNALASGVLSIWMMQQEKLGVTVGSHLEANGIPAEYLDVDKCRFKGVWSLAAHRREIESFIESNPEFDANDVGLMLSCVSGKAPVDMPEEALAQGAEILALALEYLKSLPVAAPEWERDVPDFISEAVRINEAIGEERSYIDGLNAAIGEIKAGFAVFLAFFECEAGIWDAANLLPGSDVRETTQAVSELQSLLSEYGPIHPPAAILSDEMERAEARLALQRRIIQEVRKIRLSMNPLATPTEILPASPAAEDEGVAPGEPPPVSQAEYESVQSSNRDLRRDKERLERDARRREDELSESRQQTEQLEQEVKRLESELYESQRQEESWRIAYQAYDESQRRMEDDIDGAALGMDDVATAVELAARRFDGRLIFQLNSDSMVEDNPFGRPEQVWKALQWLATTYYDSRAGDITVTDFDLSIREACGWWYKGSQGETTMTMYRSSYTTKVDGKTYWLEEHIGKGTNRDARYTIRIAFDWDRDRRAVVVGYIGRHQQTEFS